MLSTDGSVVAIIVGTVVAFVARRLQEEMYGSGDGGSGAGFGGDVDAEGVRAPMARTTETPSGEQNV